MTDSVTQEGGTIEIVRDNTFARAVADNALVLYLGRDLELGFLQTGSIPILREEDEKSVRFRFKPAITEVARIRISGQGGIELAMRILEELIMEDKADVEAVLGSISGWGAAAEKKRWEKPGDRA